MLSVDTEYTLLTIKYNALSNHYCINYFSSSLSAKLKAKYNIKYILMLGFG